MAYQIPESEPREWIAGDSWKWNKTLPDFPAGAGWQLSYYFRGETDYDADWASDVTSPTGEDGYEVRIDESNTGLAPGAYTLWGRVTDGTDVHTAVEIKINVISSPETAVDSKTFNATCLDAVEARITGTALSTEQKRIKINGREIERFEMGELEQLRAHYQHLVQLERNPNARLTHAARMTNARP